MELLPLDDSKWNNYRSGYGQLIDVTKWISVLLSNNFSETHWEFLWDELYHQGGVGEAAYAVVPYLAEFAVKNDRFDWHIWGFPVAVELARQDDKNPEIPSEIEKSYFQSFTLLSNHALGLKNWNHIQTSQMVACIALDKKQNFLARAYSEMSSKDVVVRFLKDEIG